MVGQKIVRHIGFLRNNFDFTSRSTFVLAVNKPSLYLTIAGRKHTYVSREHSSYVIAPSGTKQHSEQVQDQNTKRHKKSRPSAAKASLRRAALEAQLSQDDTSKSYLQPAKIQTETKVPLYQSLIMY